MKVEIYISVDIEAAGPIPGTYSMLSIGACVIGNTAERFYIELQPVNNAFVPAALEVTGRSMADFALKGQPPVEAMKAFKKWIEQVRKDATPVFVGFNATFDWAFINWYFYTYLNHNPFGIGGIDIKSYYMGLTSCSWSETRSSSIPIKYKGTTQHTHNALDDAIEQAEMFENMRRDHKTYKE
jgi:DNA polymerase III epsilon subunit-like protein